MTKVDKLRFGSIVINGKKYRHDVTILPDGTVKRRKGGLWMFGSHSVKEDEIQEIMNGEVSMLVIGTGTNGVARLSKEAQKLAERKNFNLSVLPSEEAVGLFNTLMKDGESVGAIIHVTC
ncbi:MAG: MTH938/NDUFAF3 family protein [Thermodesulfobacteriota bacterium]|nr:MTH938/NDUFAF3 family protein [Thermodesulfobacteriota bacterium]